MEQNDSKKMAKGTTEEETTVGSSSNATETEDSLGEVTTDRDKKQPGESSRQTLDENEVGPATYHEYADEPMVTNVETVVTRYIDHPIVEEKTIHVEKTMTTERMVPKPEIEYVDKIVEIPKIEYVDKIEEYNLEEIIYKEVPRVESRDKLVYHPKYINVDKVRHVEKPVYVQGETITNKVHKIVDVPEDTYKYVDTEMPIVVAQRVNPIISYDPDDEVQVELFRYNPKCVPVDVYIERPVYIGGGREGNLSSDVLYVPVPVGEEPQALKPIKSGASSASSTTAATKGEPQPGHAISTAEYNSWLLLLNKNVPDTRTLPFRTDRQGRFPFLPKGTVMRGSFVK